MGGIQAILENYWNNKPDVLTGSEKTIYPSSLKEPLNWQIYEPLLNALQGSSEINPYSRQYLSEVLGVNDRQVRKMKELAIADGNIIGSSSYAKGNSQGYYLPTTREEYLNILGEYTSRVKSLSRSIRAINKALELVPGQLRMDGDGTIHDDGK